MASWRGDQGCNDADKIVVHIAGIPESGGACGHDCRDQLVCLCKRWLLNMESICSDTGQSTIIQNNNRVCILRKASHGKDAVVRLNHNISYALRIGKHGICLDQFFREPII